MKVAVLGGAGKVVLGAIQDLIEQSDVEHILLADINMEALRQRNASLNSEKVELKEINLNDHTALTNALVGYDVCLNGSSHHFNMKVMKACVEAQTNYTDFGGLFHWAKEQLTMKEEFERVGITGIVGSGTAPGIVNVMAKYGYERLDSVTAVHIRDAIVNFNLGEDDFVPPYAIDTLLDEYLMSPYEFRNGAYIEEKPFSGGEEIDFPKPVGTQTVINTIHSEVATIPESFKDKGIQDMTFKLALPPTFEQKLKFLVKLGLGDATEIEVSNQKVVPRQVLAKIVNQKNSENKNEKVKHDDHKFIRVEIEGKKDGEEVKYVLDSMISPYEKWPHMSQGVFSVGFPAAVTTRLLGSKQISEKGFFASEEVIPTDKYFKELAKRGIYVQTNFMKNIAD